MRWLEIAPGYACNCRCIGCFSCSPEAGDQMQSREVLRWLQQGRREGARDLWLGGGEPTLRRDFLPTLRAARQLGYERVKVQTNGMLFSYPDFAAKAVAAGMTEANLLLKSLDPALHDELNGTPGSHALLSKAIDVLSAHPLRLEGDVLITERNFRELPALVDHYAGRGIRQFNLWLFSSGDGGPELRGLVPKLSECRPFFVEAWHTAKKHGASVVSLHSPPCQLPREAWEMLFDPAALDLVVVNPNGHRFRLEESKFEGGSYPAACEGCSVRASCPGVRAEYLEIHGAGELVAL